MTNSLAPDQERRAAPAGKRERLVAAARQMFHEQGVEKTSLADIAGRAGVPVGNVFYYFKTKDALVAAVVAGYENARVALGQALDRRRTPQARLKALIRDLADRRDSLAAHGCPVGSLACELGKRDDALHGQAAGVLSGLIGWAQQQFEAMGRGDARELAVALVAAYEGVSLLANALADPGLITAESRRLERWIDALASEATPAESTSSAS
ncbi:MAG TPA: helix-turn-helix domain-containing protein [Streptosporangiaceae bacterium]